MTDQPGVIPSRRAALTALAASCLVAIGALPAGAKSQEVRTGALDAFLDTLLPADAFGPAASRLGIGEDLLGYAAEGSDFHRLIALGTEWLDGLDARAFADLPADTRHNVLRYMEQADRAQVPGRFYLVLRQFAMELYHARADTVAGLPLNPAPQPEGYPPPWG
ncbi:hypothetical protein [Roseovarius ramblicola]|uniref:Gluconate 2-dehydrogenase subunit 3 family protein n=1 Tax=Roseovarius ramblicola TaxID=2022336 RepID=A0ABV5I338_9RHOB